MIPGTINFYHLYFLDLAKKKKVKSFTTEESKLYKKFKEQYGYSYQFIEVEMCFLVLNRLEILDEVNEKTNDKSMQKNLDVIEYIFQQYVKSNVPYFTKPGYDSRENQLASDSSDNEEVKKANSTFDFSKLFNR